MKRSKYIIYLLSLLSVCVMHEHAFGQRGVHVCLKLPDNNTVNSTGSQQEDDDKSFFKGVIPPSPQAAALARYASYQVNHTTGLPDISVPLYEICLGDFTLPVSIRYHASGARPEDIPTSVGSGWSLIAGGAVTRTVLGKPDMFYKDMRDSDFTYFDDDNVTAMLYEVNSTGGGTADKQSQEHRGG